MIRTRSYRRKQRIKHINHRVYILKNCYYPCGINERPHGMFDKGKIHCSCPICSMHTRNKGKRRGLSRNYQPSYNWKHSDMLKINTMEDKEKEFEISKNF